VYRIWDAYNGINAFGMHTIRDAYNGISNPVDSNPSVFECKH